MHLLIFIPVFFFRLSGILGTVSAQANQPPVEAKTPSMGPFWAIPPSLLIRALIDVVGLEQMVSNQKCPSSNI